MAGGRPPEYTPELVKAAWAYVKGETYKVVPSVAGLCCEINIARSTAYEWAKDEAKEFSDILSAIATKQENLLLEKGLQGEFNSTITKLMLTKHGYSDKQELEHSGNPDKPLVTRIEQVIVDPTSQGS